jgi:hypothetical protein
VIREGTISGAFGRMPKDFVRKSRINSKLTCFGKSSMKVLCVTGLVSTRQVDRSKVSR